MQNRSRLPVALTIILAVVLSGCGAHSVSAQAVARPAAGNPGASMSDDALSKIIAQSAAPIRKRIQASPGRFRSLLAEVLAEPPILVRLVDKTHPLPEGYAPQDLVHLRDYYLTLNRKDLELRKLAMPDLLAMVHAARLDHVVLALSSTYRSYEYQKKVFELNVRELGLKEAERESAHPGTSQHQLGTTIDFGSITPAFAHTRAGRWLAANAWKYGFTMSYPEGYEKLTGYIYEPWHFRYIGKPAAAMQHEFFGGIQQELLLFLHASEKELRLLAASGALTKN